MAAKNKFDNMVIFDGPNGPFSNDRLFDQAEYLEYLKAKADKKAGKKAAKDSDGGTDDGNAVTDNSSDDASSTSADGVEDEDKGSEPVNYGDLDGKQLKALAKERNIDISGMKKVSELREALQAHDSTNS